MTLFNKPRTRPLIQSFVACAALALGLSLLSGCGGGSSSSSSTTDPSGSSNVTTLVVTDTVVGTGTQATTGKSVTVNYTGWLYNVSATNYKGTQFDTSVGKAPLTFTLGSGQVISGFDQGVTGMKVGGKRTIIIPSALAYGSTGVGNTIPANAALVFDLELMSVQ